MMPSSQLAARGKATVGRRWMCSRTSLGTRALGLASPGLDRCVTLPSHAEASQWRWLRSCFSTRGSRGCRTGRMSFYRASATAADGPTPGEKHPPRSYFSFSEGAESSPSVGTLERVASSLVPSGKHLWRGSLGMGEWEVQTQLEKCALKTLLLSSVLSVYTVCV